MVSVIKRMRKLRTVSKPPLNSSLDPLLTIDSTEGIPLPNLELQPVIQNSLLTPFQLLAIRVGAGAAILPPEVTKIHMDFALKIEDGHAGAKYLPPPPLLKPPSLTHPRTFWRQCLPRLKYHNPTIPMTVSRSCNQKGPSTMTVTFSSPPTASSSFTSTPERIELINMKNKNVSVILTKLMELTKAKAVRATAEELRQIQEFEEQQKKCEEVRVLMARETERIKKEKDMLEQSRGETASEENFA